MIKFKNLLSNIIKVKTQRGMIAYLHRLEENDYFKLKSQSKDLNIILEIESDKSELLKIIKNFSEDLIYLDIHKNSLRKDSLDGLEKYIKVSEDASKAWSIRVCLILFLLLFVLLGFFMIHPRVFPLLSDPFIISFVFFLLFFLSIYPIIYWSFRSTKYRATSFALNRLSNKIISANDCINWDYYTEIVCKIPRVFIKDAENILIYELRKMEREFDAGLEFIYIFAFIAAVITSLLLTTVGFSTNSFIGFGVLIAIFLAFYRYFSRKSKDFRVNCLEQLLLLLRLAQNKLD